MTDVVFYAAVSLDGFLAGKNGDMSWAEKYLGGDDDFGYLDLVRNSSAMLMGRKTFEFELSAGADVDRILPTYVFTSQPLRFDGLDTSKVNFIGGDLREVVQHISNKHPGQIFVSGGAELVDGLLTMGLLDEMRLFITPDLLGQGLRLFKGSRIKNQPQLVKSTSHSSGLVELHYRFTAG
ncbi:dihydrofolate reductase family protein [Candidatus Rhodoluna planktonica]|uniref:Bacterial bifunctional deaminase-reductase C-terminal domain-containing protein n=1 Tax=Candidatus Rhodoluna planktonica TaxID=535712 RepID=A0A1D9DZV9_9MICO|nr:dihydrofolate reductase family protein [Candidatus Rhodoluna planktonica]AOY56343.1 hypothetical protein A4Z71_05150 [Candidatus Rhodoluna planktonica]